jgi:hypothetical protein
VVTRYNQTVDELIASVAVDSLDILSAFKQEWGVADWRYPFLQSQYLNIGTIRNQGWELQGSTHAGPITTRGTYSWTKSRSLGMNPKYRAQFNPRIYPQYQPGAAFSFLPEHTWALGVTYARAGSSVAFNLAGRGGSRKGMDEFYLHNLSVNVRLLDNRMSMTPAHTPFNPPYSLADLTASHRFTSRVEGVLQVQNLTDLYVNDRHSGYGSLGRQSKFGVRVRTN